MVGPVRPSSGAPSSTPGSPHFTKPPMAYMGHRASWPTCAPRASGCRARRCRRRCAVRAWPGSARAPSRRPPRWSTWTPRSHPTGSDGGSTPVSWIGCGRRISPICSPAKAGCIYARSATAARGGGSAGASALTIGAALLRPAGGVGGRGGCSRRVIGWAIDDHMRADLVESAVAMAVAMRGELADEVILHADRGCQYTSSQIARFADRHNLTRSVGRTGVCWDNAAAESFWATLKVEFYDRYLWPSRAAAKLVVGDWIERVYNRRRRHSALGMISPVEYEDRFNQTAQAA